MTACVVCQEREPDYEARSQACARCAGRLAGALRQIPVLVDELRGLGFVERDARFGYRRVLEERGGEKVVVQVPSVADPVANVFSAGPAAGGWRESRIRGTRPERVPISLDASDLTAPARAGSVAVHAGRYAGDQEGHLSAATVLDFWVRDWADLRGEGLPPLRTAGERSPAGLLAGWLTDRLDWALRSHLALDEFARDVADLFGALFGAARGGRVRPKVMGAPCRRCDLSTLVQETPEDNINCHNPDCQAVYKPEEYAEWVRTLINETTA